MNSDSMDASEDLASRTRPSRPLRKTAARKVSEERRQAERDEKREQLKNLERVENDDDLSDTQRKKITNLRKDLGINPTGKSVDPQSKPQYPESASGNNEEDRSEKSPQIPGSGDSPSSENERLGVGNQKRNGYSGSPSTQAAPKTSSEMTHEGGVATAYCRCKSFGNSRIIYRYGPPGHSKYEFGPPKAHADDEIKRLPLISGKRETILDIQEDGRWLYGFLNIKKIVYVVTLTPNPHRKWKPRYKKGKAIHVFPTILVGVQWDQIQERHKRLLTDGESWNFRGKLMERLKKKEKISLDNWIRDAAMLQDQSYEAWIKKNGVTNRDRPPTFFPGADWANVPVQPKKTKSQSVRTGSNSKNSSLDSQENGSPGEESHHSGKKRSRANSGANSACMKKPRSATASTEKSTERYIDWSSYLCTNMIHFGLTDKKREDDPDGYMETLDTIHKGWSDYRQNMIKRGFKILPGGEKPEA